MYDKERTRTGENSSWTIIITFTIGEVLLFSMMDLFADQIALMYLDRADPASFFLFLPASR